MNAAAPWPVVIPIIGACVSVLLADRRAARSLALGTLISTAAAALVLVIGVWRGGDSRYALGGWAAPVGIELGADGLGAGLVLVGSIAGVVLTTYALGYYPAGTAREWTAGRAFWPLWLFLFAALHGLFLSADVFNLYVGLELLTLCALGLVMLAPGRESAGAAMRYLLAAFLGSVLYLLGVAVLYAETHALSLTAIGATLDAGPAAWLAVSVITAGLMLKCALFPLHFWLPRAHASAPAPVSAVLSAFVVAGAFVMLLRLWFVAFAGVVTLPLAQGLGILGALGIGWGSLQALRQQRLKLMIAYSTVAQVGYFFLLFPLATGIAGEGPWRLDAWRGGIYLVAAHALAKAAMFMMAGSVTRSIGHDRILGVSGIATHLPISTYAFGIAGMSLIGLPPSAGFVGKWLLLKASLASGQWWWAVVIVVGGVLTAGYVFLVLGQELSDASGDETPKFDPVPRRMEWAAMAMAVLAVLLGSRALEPLALLMIGNPIVGAP